MLPQLESTVVRFNTYDRCQLAFVVAKELQRADPGLSVTSAYTHARMVAEQLDGLALGMGARHGEVVWPQFICWASVYAQHHPDMREQMLVYLKQGYPMWPVPASRFEPQTLCDPKALLDPDYEPEPGCVPKEASRAAVVAGTAFAVGIGIALVSRLFRR